MPVLIALYLRITMLSCVSLVHIHSEQTWVDDLFYKALAYVLDLDMVVDTTMVGTVQSGLSQV
jgi:hypothetical protein